MKTLNYEAMKNIDKEYGTPVYIYDASVIRTKIEELKWIIPKCCSILYSVKANPLCQICKIMDKSGIGFEVSSASELLMVRKCNISASHIVFSGPGKSMSDIDYAIRECAVIEIESFGEAERIIELAKRYKTKVNVGVRVNLEAHVKSKIKMSGSATQFGIPESDIDKIIFKLKNCENINILGYKVYFGTQNLDAENIADNTDKIINGAYELSIKHNLDFQYINLGGGFGTKYFSHEKELDIKYLQKKLEDIFFEKRKFLMNKSIYFESGRFLVAKAGFFVVKVQYVKRCNNRIFIVCNGGASFHSSAAFLGRYVRNNFPFFTISKGNEHSSCQATVVGPLCSPMDVLLNNVQIENVKQDDYIVIEMSGAYGLTYSPVMFLGQIAPAEILIDSGQIKVMRERGKLDDILQKQYIDNYKVVEITSNSQCNYTNSALL